MESLTYFKNLKISPKKLRFMLPSIKKMKPRQAIDKLMYTTSKPARMFYKAINSALSNARHTLKVDDNLLQFKVLTVEEGFKIRRSRAGSRGTPEMFKRRMAHIKIILQSEQKDQIAKPEPKVEQKVEQKEEVKAVAEKPKAKPKIVKAKAEVKSKNSKEK